MEEVVEKIEPVDKSEKSTAKEPLQRVQPDKERFDDALQQGNKSTAVESPVADSQKTTIMDTARNMARSGSSSPVTSHDSLIAQTQEAIQKIEQIKHVLETPNVEIKSSAKQLLQNKLQHIDESLKVALSKAGVEYDPTGLASASSSETPTRVNPIERFLGFLTDGQWQLEHLGHELRTMAQQNQEISPVNMLAVQVKVGQIQQELDLFSSLLNKALESIKTIMNIQV